MKFDQLTVAILVRAEGAPTLDTKTADDVQDAHMAHLASMHEQGFLLAAGPFLVGAGEKMRGISIFKGSPEDTAVAAKRDPAVQAGLLTYLILPWMVPSGAVSFAPTRFPHSMKEAEGDRP